jgi:hypothetical protein
MDRKEGMCPGRTRCFLKHRFVCFLFHISFRGHRDPERIVVGALIIAKK